MFFRKIVYLSVFATLFLVMCKKNEHNQETILKGKAEVLVDESLVPIIEDQIQIFESKYDAKITLIPTSEVELINTLINNKYQIAIMARDLSQTEYKSFDQLKIKPKVTKFAKDAIVFIRKSNAKDSLIELKSVIDFMKGKTNQSFKGIVFDNPNSSCSRYIKKLADVKDLPNQGVYSFANSKEVIQFISKNDNMIGVVGLNSITQPMPSMQQYLDKVTVLAVKHSNGNQFYYPNQNNLAEETYPLARELYIVNVQGFSGLGMGFASFVAGEIGQRIVLRSGLLPIFMPSRKISIRKQIIENEN